MSFFKSFGCGGDYRRRRFFDHGFGYGRDFGRGFGRRWGRGYGRW
jgi:hypothetical protein